MSLLGRTWRVIRANTRDLGRQRQDDPARDLERALAQLQQELTQLRQAVARAVATQKRTERQAHDAQQQAAEWQQRARLALQKQDEAQAR
ncbi:MAG: PspA/IM30 family protein, partial [Cyanobacteria bacterium J06641_5]